MRIRRRPQALIPSPYPPQLQQASSDPSTAPSETPPPNQHHWLPRYEEEEEAEETKELHSYHSNVVDLGDEPSPPMRRGAPLPWSHPQGNNVVGRSSGDGRGAQRRQGEVADGPGSQENGHGDEREWPATDAAGERPVNGSVVPATAPAASTVPQLDVKERATVKSDGPKRRRGPAVLLEGSRCSRVNGRGWRCSQPTLVGYSLCEHHLGKGRQSRSGRTTAGVPKLGRTEPASSREKNAAALAVVPDAAETAAHLING